MKQIYYNGKILTLENKDVEAILVKDGKIEEIGTKNEIFQKIKNEKVEKIDLEGACLMPSFIDSHSHITSFAQTIGIAQLNIATSFKDIIDVMKEFKSENLKNENEWIIGFGYDNNFLKEKSHPTKEILDEISKTNPILITHKSGHMGVMNTKALEIVGINKNTSNPDGGIIGKDKKTQQPNGYLEENAFINMSKNIVQNSQDQMTKLIKKVENVYASYGITTIQDGLTKEAEFNLLMNMAENEMLNLDIISYIDLKNAKNVVERNRRLVNKYYNHYKIGGYKLFLDGSPQGRTAWMSKPYEGDETYCGYPIYKTHQIEDFVQNTIDEEVQLITHCNGDAASEELIKAYEKIGAFDNYRPVMIHAQLVRKDQLKRMKKIQMIPSFFVAHTYYWGDTHIKNFGKRAQEISPIKTAIEEELIYTMHQDTPVLMPNMFETIWCAVKRKTKNGIELGKEQKITVLEAIKGVTINAAYQYFEENVKGSIKKGKNADLIIIDKNPLEIDIDEIKNINILYTIKNGEIIYKKRGI